jgi:hypothetical protein
MRTFWIKVVEKIKTHIYIQKHVFENRAVYEIMSKIMVKSERPQVTIWRMRVVCWISKATRPHTHARARERMHGHTLVNANT